MATWHQQRSTARLYHDTKWTVVSDPPNDCRTLMLFNTADEATAYVERVNRPHTYVLPPARRETVPALRTNTLDTAYGRWDSGWKNL